MAVVIILEIQVKITSSSGGGYPGSCSHLQAEEQRSEFTQKKMTNTSDQNKPCRSKAFTHTPEGPDLPSWLCSPLPFFRLAHDSLVLTNAGFSCNPLMFFPGMSLMLKDWICVDYPTLSHNQFWPGLIKCFETDNLIFQGFFWCFFFWGGGGGGGGKLLGNAFEPFPDSLASITALRPYQQPYHPAAQDLPTEAKQGWDWSVPGWETSWENQVAAGRGVYC